jgi:predicted aminopeptidase
VNGISNPGRILLAASLALLACATAGCYLIESAAGQLSLMSKRQPIERVMRAPSSPPALRAQLAQVSAIRDFASRQLGLPDNGSYRSYADLGRPFAVWNVVAAPEFSVEAKQWCFPIVGCVEYRGYFREAQARSYAQALRGRGYDVSVGGVAAYSTLGHFDDPVLNTMMGWDDVELAGIVFHELTHQMLYVAGDASFNEALATTVEEEGVRRWLLSQERRSDLDAHLAQRQRDLRVIGLLRRTRAELGTLYGSGIDAPAMRAAKRAAFGRLREEYASMTREWRNAPFRSWFNGEINNAHLASVATYYDCVPGFERELAAAGGDLRRFYQRVFALAKQDAPARDAALCATS